MPDVQHQRITCCYGVMLSDRLLSHEPSSRSTHSPRRLWRASARRRYSRSKKRRSPKRSPWIGTRSETEPMLSCKISPLLLVSSPPSLVVGENIIMRMARAQILALARTVCQPHHRTKHVGKNDPTDNGCGWSKIGRI